MLWVTEEQGVLASCAGRLLRQELLLSRVYRQGNTAKERHHAGLSAPGAAPGDVWGCGVTQSLLLQAGAAATSVPWALGAAEGHSHSAAAHTRQGWAGCRTSSVSANVATSGKCEHQEDWHGREEPCSDLWVAGRCQERAQAEEQLGKTGE